jgi:hypothetical protein
MYKFLHKTGVVHRSVAAGTFVGITPRTIPMFHIVLVLELGEFYVLTTHVLKHTLEFQECGLHLE